MSSDVTFTFRVDHDLNDQFAQAAKKCDRSRAQLIRDFMQRFVSQQQDAATHDAWFQKQVQVGIDEANAGDLISADQVEAEAQAWRHTIQTQS